MKSDKATREKKEKAKREENREEESLGSVLLTLILLIGLVFAFKISFLDANNIPSGSMIPTLKVGDYLFVNKMRYSLRFPFLQYEIAHIDDPKRGDIITFIPPPPADSDKNYVKRVMGMPGDRIRIRNIPLCDLYNVMGVKPPDMPEGESAFRRFSCNRSVRSDQVSAEPIVAFVEYKEHDQGQWLNYHPRELPEAEAKRVLTDADDFGVLSPDYFPNQSGLGYLSVLLQESVNGKTYHTVERAVDVSVHSICPGIAADGCLIPDDSYFVMGDNRDNSRDSRYIGYIQRNRIQGKALLIYFSINWRDEFCSGYEHWRSTLPYDDAVLTIPDFPPKKQIRYCSFLDQVSDTEGIGGYLKRTFTSRIPRMSIRFSRIGTIIK